jgi:hypothetical protein
MQSINRSIAPITVSIMLIGGAASALAQAAPVSE